MHNVINFVVSVLIKYALNVNQITILILYFRNVYYKLIQHNNVDSIVSSAPIKKIVIDA